MGLTLNVSAVRSARKATRIAQDLVDRLVEDLTGLVAGTVAVSGLTYDPSKKGTAGSDGYAYREAVGLVLVGAVPVPKEAYPLRSVVRPVGPIVEALKPLALAASGIEDLPEDADAAARKAHKAQVQEAYAAHIPAPYLTAPSDHLTWMLQVLASDTSDA
jgi:hypothetical protein